MITTACPARDDLTNFALGKLPDDRSESIAVHLSACLACQETLRAFDYATDPLIASLRAPLVEDPYVRESGCPEAIALVEAIGREPSIGAKPGSARTTAPPQDLGQVGQYRLLAKVGEGGMGTVYRALHTRLDKIVALKLLPRDRTQDSRAVARFEREMKAVGRLEHPHIVRATDANEQDGTHYLVMEYVDGCDLGELVRRHGPLAIADACELIRQAAVGLQYAHENGLVHRDIKPSNVMLTREGQVKILDLGLALLRADESIGREMTGEGQMMGTADYIAPEQATDAHSVDIRADIYSLGCTLYKLLTGQAPFAGASHKKPLEVVLAHLQKPIPSVRVLRPEVPQELASIVARMTAKSPAERFAAPAEVAAALESFAAGYDSTRLMCETAEATAKPTVDEPSRTNTDDDVSSAMTGTAPSGPMPTASAAVPAQAICRGSSRRRISIALAAAVAAIPLLFGVWVIVRDKEGNELARVRLPEGGSVTQERDVPASSPGVSGAKPSPVISQPVPFPPWNFDQGSPAPAIAPFDAAKAKEHQNAWAKHLRVPVEMTNAIGMRFVLIPPGEFEMGSTEAEVAELQKEAKVRKLGQRYIDLLRAEVPKRRVRIAKPFYLGQCEVTQAEYEQVMGNNPSYFKHDLTRPVEMLRSDEAFAFCRKIGEVEQATHGSYGLPTEAEWEYACRAGTTTAWYSGDTIGTLNDCAWFRGNSEPTTHPVRQKAPNAWGLYDMHGNVWEWCHPWWGGRHYATSPMDDPAAAGRISDVVRRGGSWDTEAPGCRAAFGFGGEPRGRDANLGFRLVRTVNLPSSSR